MYLLFLHLVCIIVSSRQNLIRNLDWPLPPKNREDTTDFSVCLLMQMVSSLGIEVGLVQYIVYVESNSIQFTPLHLKKNIYLQIYRSSLTAGRAMIWKEI